MARYFASPSFLPPPSPHPPRSASSRPALATPSRTWCSPTLKSAFALWAHVPRIGDALGSLTLHTLIAPPPAPIRFPHGLADLAAYFHSLGLLAGIYTDVAHLTCAGYEGSGPGPDNLEGHWPLDALTYAQWGFDMFEADFCNTGGLPANYTAFALYSAARDAIAAATAATGRVIAFYQCNWGEQSPWEWGPQTANLFRNTGDICAPGEIAWGRILSNFDNTIVHSNTPGAAPGLPGTGIGAWNDPGA